MPAVEIKSLQDLDHHAQAVGRSAETSARRIADLVASNPGLGFLHALRFEPLGVQPLGTEPLNIVEQLNQTFTYLASFAATRFLFNEFPGDGPYTLNLGTTPGPDIVSKSRHIVAEVFAAVDPENNRKLTTDIGRVLREKDAVYRFVFYYSPGRKETAATIERRGDVTIVALNELI